MPSLLTPPLRLPSDITFRWIYEIIWHCAIDILGLWNRPELQNIWILGHTYMEEFYSRRLKTCRHPFPYSSWCAHLPTFLASRPSWVRNVPLHPFQIIGLKIPNFAHIFRKKININIMQVQIMHYKNISWRILIKLFLCFRWLCIFL
jgi:hypothetical protein